MNKAALTILGFAAAFLLFARVSYAATLEFSPSSGNIDIGETFQTDVVINLGSQEGQGIDAYITYDPDVLEVVDVVEGDVLTLTTDITDPGEMYLIGITEQPGESITGEGKFATITFRGKSTGTSSLEFTCEPGETNESNIVESSKDALDIIQCSLNGGGVIIVNGGTGGGDDNNSSSSGNPRELPQTGVFDNLILLSGLGGILLLAGLVSRALLFSKYS